MKLAILANEDQKKEWLSKPQQGNVELVWLADHDQLVSTIADAYFDLLFLPEAQRLDSLLSLNGPVFINEVVLPFSSLVPEHSGISPSRKFPLFRINAWPTFLKREILEMTSLNENNEEKLAPIFSALGWKFKLVPDIPGLITARVIAMVINEAYYTLEAEVSSKKEIDVAMKLGTNYPYGPFEWSELIGLPQVYRLLLEMSRTDQKYQPAESLRTETEELSAWH